MPLTFDEQVEKMKNAPMRRGGGNWIVGEGLFEIEVLSTMRKMGWNQSFTVRDKELFIAEFRIVSVQSTSEEVVKKHAAGTTASWTCKDPSTSGTGDLKSFAIACTGTDPRTVKDADDAAQNQAALLAFAAMGEAEAFKRLGLPETFFVGARLRLETKITTKKNGDPFTKHIWSPGTAPAVAA